METKHNRSPNLNNCAHHYATETKQHFFSKERIHLVTTVSLRIPWYSTLAKEEPLMTAFDANIKSPHVRDEILSSQCSDNYQKSSKRFKLETSIFLFIVFFRKEFSAGGLWKIKFRAIARH